MFGVQQQQKNHKAYKEVGTYRLFKGKKHRTKTIHEKDWMAHLLDKVKQFL